MPIGGIYRLSVRDESGQDTGNDTVMAGAGRDNLTGGAGRNRPFGGFGKDHLNGNAGDDTLRGDAGNDTIYALDGVIDLIDGGDGTDSGQLDSADNRISVEVLI